jgi:hypothetical protein
MARCAVAAESSHRRRCSWYLPGAQRPDARRRRGRRTTQVTGEEPAMLPGSNFSYAIPRNERDRPPHHCESYSARFGRVNTGLLPMLLCRRPFFGGVHHCRQCRQCPHRRSRHRKPPVRAPAALRVSPHGAVDVARPRTQIGHTKSVWHSVSSLQKTVSLLESNSGPRLASEAAKQKTLCHNSDLFGNNEKTVRSEPEKFL